MILISPDLYPLRSKLINFTRAKDGANADVAYTGVGFKPTLVRIFGEIDTTNLSIGEVAVVGGDYCLNSQPGANFVEVSGVLVKLVPGGAGQSAVLKSFDDDGFTLTWTKAGAHLAGNCNLFAICSA